MSQAEVPEGATSLQTTTSGGDVTNTAGFSMESVASAEIEKAQLTVALWIAEQRPRKFEVVREKMLEACRRPIFAEKAMYHLPVGQGISGVSIRFVEAAIQAMGNLRCTQSVSFDSPDRRKVMITVMDCESGSTFQMEIVIQKTIERRQPKKGDPPIEMRFNSYGDRLYIYRATDDEMANKAAAMVSKAFRTTGLRLIPADLVEECVQLIEKTAGDAAAKDPDAWKRMADAFSGLNVPIDQLTQYLGCALKAAQPAQVVELQALYMAIKEGEATWAEAMEMRDSERSADAGEGDGDEGDEVGPQAEKLRGTIRDRIKAQEDKARSQTPSAPPSDKPEPPATEEVKKGGGKKPAAKS